MKNDRVRKGVRTRALGPAQTEGARLLWEALPRFGGQNGLERALYDRFADEGRNGVVNRWLHCRVCPSLAWAVRIEEVTGIPVAAWSIPPREKIRFVVVHN